MKLIYIVNSRIPTEKAHGFQITKMCESFSDAGVETELWLPSRRNEIKKNIYEFYGVKNNFKVKIIKSFDFIRYARILGKIAFYFQSLWFLFKLARIKAGEDAVIFSRAPEIIWLFKLKGGKTCYESHDWFGKNKKISLFLLKKSDYIVTTNNFIKNEFVKNNFSENKILSAPHGVNHKIFDLDFSREEALEKLDIGNDIKNKIKDKNILVYTGSFKTNDEEKGIGDILKALKKLDDNNFIFLAVGGAREYIKEYLEISKALKIDNQVCFFEKRPQADLALFQKIADVLLMPFPRIAHYEFFMTPLKMFEYMLSKRPVIASDLPSIREIFNEKNGIFCQPGNPDDLADKIFYVINNPIILKKLAEQAYKDGLKYTWQARVNKILDFIKQ